MVGSHECFVEDKKSNDAADEREKVQLRDKGAKTCRLSSIGSALSHKYDRLMSVPQRM